MHTHINEKTFDRGVKLCVMRCDISCNLFICLKFLVNIGDSGDHVALKFCMGCFALVLH